MHLVRLKRLGIVRLSQTRRSLFYHRALQIFPFILVLAIFSTLMLISIRQSPLQTWRFPISNQVGTGGMPGVMYKYQQHLKHRSDQQFRVDLLLQRDAPSVEKAARELLSSVAESNVSDGSDNITDIATSPLPPCHLNPDTLLGRLNVSLAVPSWDDEIPHVLFGGEWKPPHCISRDLVAVVIPYRDRKSHLITLLHHLHPILQRQMLHYKIFVVEQAGNDTFNKGVLMNSAFKLILQHHTYPGAVIFHCFVFHDVDLLMEDDRNMLSLPYNNLVGGVFIIRTEHFLRVNGYSNLYWGWGGEDDDMGFRVLQLGLQITRPLPQLGLNTLKFTHLETKAEKYFTRLVVSVGTPPPKIIQLQAVFEKNRQAKKKPPPPYKPAKLPT
ncbi:hypothetical protein M8J75_006268 [Diaphorina citri]|nr:hypothetical protein M8J75_006268 [Diaphorina citri]